MRNPTMPRRADRAGDKTVLGRAMRIALLAGICGLGTVPAYGKVRFEPSVDVRQVIGYDGYGGDDFETWSELGAGFQAALDSRRVQGYIDYRLRQRFPIVGNIDDNTRHDLLARTNAELVRDLLFFNAGGFATMVNNDLRGFVSFNPDSDSRNQSQTFNVFAEPSLTRTFFNRFDLFASYRISYSDVSDADIIGIGEIAEDPSAVLGRGLSDSHSQTGTVRLSNRAQSSRLRWSLTGTATRENIDQLNQRYKSYRGVLDLEYAFNQTISLLGSVGYEDILNTQDSILTNPITGEPILTPDGRFQVDPRQPRRTAYDESGVTFDVGIRLSPSRRTNFFVRGGRRFGGDTYSAELSYQLTPSILITGSYDESIDSYGRLLTESLNGIPIRGIRVEDSVTIGPGGCVIGIDLSNFRCINGLSQSIYAATFKEKRARLSIAAERGRLSALVSGFYSDRTYLDSEQLLLPGQPPIDPSIIGDGDVTIGATASAEYQLSGPEALEANFLVQRSNFTLSRGRNDVYASASARYNLKLDRNISAFALLYYGHRWSDVVHDYSEATLSVGARYSF